VYNQRYLRRQTTPQQMMVKQTARPMNPTAITAAAATSLSSILPLMRSYPATMNNKDI